MNGEMDPTVMMALTLVSVGVTTIEKLMEIWRRGGVDDATLLKIREGYDKRLAQWQAL